MKSSLYVPLIGFALFLSNCSSPKSNRIITGEIYYPEENVTCLYEMNQDSVLHGKVIWSDSSGYVYLEETYVNGKSIRKHFKERHENGQISVETEYVKDKEISRKEYLPDGSLRLQIPFDHKKVGKLQYIINDGKRDYLIKNQEDTIEFFAENLPPETN